MAKWGEGDPRWIVEERPDARNVNNWHWAEKNANGWSTAKLKELFENITIEGKNIVITCGTFSKLKGEASANNRKAKLIFLYDWEITLPFQARIAGVDMGYKGEIEIPNLSDENDIDEVEISIHVETNGAHRDLVRQTLMKADILRTKIGEYITLLKEEFSKDVILPTNNVKPQVISSGKTMINSSAAQASSTAPTQRSTENNEIIEKTSFDLKDTFKTHPAHVYQILSDQQMVNVWARGASKWEFREGGEFLLFGGNASGKFVKIQPDKSIEMKWRLKSYPVGVFADLTLELEDEGNGTVLRIKAADVPLTKEEETKIGLDRYYLQAIGISFGISTRL